MKARINDITPTPTGLDIDKEVLERMMKDVETEDVYIRSTKDGRIVRAKSQYAKRLIKLDRARFVCTVEEAKEKGITIDSMAELEAFANANKTIIIQ